MYVYVIVDNYFCKIRINMVTVTKYENVIVWKISNHIYIYSSDI